MKKLMVAVVVTLFGLAANAASCSWTTEWVYAIDQSHNTYTGIPDYSMNGKYWIISYTDASDVSVDASGNVIGATEYYNAKGSAGEALTVATGLGDSITGLSAADNGTKIGLVLFYTGTEGQYWGLAEGSIAGIVDPNPGASITGSDATPVAFDNDGQGASYVIAATKIEAVPEPTSGLLLLLGVAGLALRRRRA